jgi:hypothetical protein
VRWRNQIAELAAGEDVYLHHAYPNPPIMGLILYPLTLLPPVIGALAWYYLKAGMALIALRWTFQLVEEQDRPFPLAAQWVVVLLTLRPMLGDLTHGNVNLFILFMVIGSLVLFQRRHDGYAGMVLGLAIACKVTPALFVPYFLWKRAWRMLAGCAMGLVLFFGVIPGSPLGWERNASLLGSWTTMLARPYVTAGEVLYTEHRNQSLPAVALRLTTASPSYITYVDGKLTPAAYHNLLDLEPVQAQWLIRGCMVLFVAVIVWCCRTPTAVRHGWLLPAEFSLVLLGMLLFSERTWKHHCVVLVVPLAVIVYGLAGVPLAARPRLWVCVALAAAVVLTFTSTLGSPGELAEVYGVHLWAHLLLLGALVILLRNAPNPIAEPQSCEVPCG